MNMDFVQVKVQEGGREKMQPHELEEDKRENSSNDESHMREEEGDS